MMNIIGIQFNSPKLCGKCHVCESAGDFARRLNEFMVNHDPHEQTNTAAIRWMNEGYPPCPPPPVTMDEALGSVIYAAACAGIHAGKVTYSGHTEMMEDLYNNIMNGYPMQQWFMWNGKTPEAGWWSRSVNK